MLPGLRILVPIAAALLLLALPAAVADPDQYGTLAPSVVREGDFARELVAALTLPETADDEQQAMAALSARGIEPLQGWEPDYPMTPQIVADLHLDIANAALAGRLGMDVDTALRAFSDLVARLGLPLPMEPAPDYSGDAGAVYAYPPSCDLSPFDDYYGSYGPPIYTYCSPPAAYLYLYSWVPYRFHWHDHHYPGYYVLKQVRVFPHDRRREPPHGTDRDRDRDHDRSGHDRDRNEHAGPGHPPPPPGAARPHAPDTARGTPRPVPPTTPPARPDTTPRVHTYPVSPTGSAWPRAADTAGSTPRPIPPAAPTTRRDTPPRVNTYPVSPTGSPWTRAPGAAGSTPRPVPPTTPAARRDTGPRATTPPTGQPGVYHSTPPTATPPPSHRRVLPAPATSPPARLAPSAPMRAVPNAPAAAPHSTAPAAPHGRVSPHSATPAQSGSGASAPAGPASAPSR